MNADKWPNVRILHTEQCSNGIERGHAQRNIHGSDAKSKRVHRSKKHALEEQNMRELDQTREAYGPTRKFYQAIAGHRNNVVPKVICCRNKDGDLVSNQPEVLSRWVQYFDELLNDKVNKQVEAPLADSVMSVLQDRLVPHVEEIVGNYQRGFWNGKSTTDQIFTMRQILDKMAEYKNDTISSLTSKPL